MNRRQLIFRTGAAAAVALGLSRWPSAVFAADGSRKHKVLFFTKSAGYEHAVIKRKDGQPSFVEKLLAEWGPPRGIEFVFSKDGSLFTPDYLAQFDTLMFYTTGDLTGVGKDGNPPMTKSGKAAFLDAIHNGKGFVGIHSASDTFHSGETNESNTAAPRASRHHNLGDKADPYVRMLGCEFIIHGKQQVAPMIVEDTKFPGMAGLPGKDRFELMEEWYSLTDFSKDLHVLLAQDTRAMTGIMYQRPPYPATWARMHGKGRVFYTSMGHREETWQSPWFQDLLMNGLGWTLGTVDADVTPNIEKVTPECWTLPPTTQASPDNAAAAEHADKQKAAAAAGQ